MNDRAAPQRPLAATCLVGMAFCIGEAVEASNGNLHPVAIVLVAAAVVLGTLAVALPQQSLWTAKLSETLPLLLIATLAYQFSELFTHPAGIYLRPSPNWLLPFFTWMAMAGVVAGSAVFVQGWMRYCVLGGLLVVHFVLGSWLIHTSPSPFIDVFMFQRDSGNALLSGINPYGITFPDIYGNSPFYGEGVVQNGRLTFGFPYPPLSLLLALPGQLFAGDYRYSQLIAMELAAAFMAFARPMRFSLGIAALFLFTPRVWFVLEQGWTEPLCVAVLAAVVFCAARFRKGLPWAMGLLVGVKQYMVFALPLSLLLFERPYRWREIGRFWAKAVGVAAIITIPFVITQPAGFIRSVMVIQFLQPFRREALSFLAWLAEQGGPQLPSAVALVAALAGCALALWRAPRTIAGFAMSMTFVYLLFFSFNKQAFCNYYFFVIGAACIAASAGNDGAAP